LSNIVDRETIEAANKEVTAVLKTPTQSVIILTLSPTEGNCSPYLKATPTQKALVAQYAAVQLPYKKCQQIGVTWPCQSAISTISRSMQP